MNTNLKTALYYAKANDTIKWKISLQSQLIQTVNETFLFLVKNGEVLARF